MAISFGGGEGLELGEEGCEVEAGAVFAAWTMQAD